MSISSVLFICLGNICRSPLAEGVFRNEASKRGVIDRLEIDSAGTGGWHLGDPPDHRSIEIAARHGIDINDQTCRKITVAHFHNFDLILAMDNSNIINARAANHENGAAQLLLFTEFANMELMAESDKGLEIPDPYYGGTQGFEIAYQMIKQASIGTLDRLFDAN